MSTKKPQETEQPRQPSQSAELDEDKLDTVSGGGGGVWNFHVWNEGVVAPSRGVPAKKLP